MSCQDDEPDAGARQLLGGKPGPKPPPKSRAGGGTSPLHLASCRGHVGVVHELLIAGADATRGDQFGYSALHLAAKHGFPDVITELLSFSSVDVNLLDESGETALHTAARYAKTMCMSRLLEHGGDLNILSRSGRRAMDVVGQPQDKHNLQSLPHSATQLAGTGVSRRSHKFNTNMPPAQLPRDRCTEERIRRLLTVAAAAAADGGKKSGWMWPGGVLVDLGDAPPAAAKDDGAGGAADGDDTDTWDPPDDDDSDSDTDMAEGAADDAAGAHAIATTRECKNVETAATAAAAGSAPATSPIPKEAAQGNGWAGAPRRPNKAEHAAVAENASPAGGGGAPATAPATSTTAAADFSVPENTSRDVPTAAEVPVSVVGSNGPGAPDHTLPPAAAFSAAGVGAADAAGADAAAGGAAAGAHESAKGPAVNGDIEGAVANGDKDAPAENGGIRGPASTGENGAAGVVGGVPGEGCVCGRGATGEDCEADGLAASVSKALPSPLARLNVRRLIRGGGKEGNADVFEAINR